MRSTTIRENQLPLELQQQIDACCDKYEQALQQGQTPVVSDYLDDVPPAGHVVLRREFSAIELAYQRTQARRDSQGLRLRCPHCQNQVELLDDAQLEEITCNSCGDTFSLVDDDSTTGGLQDSQRVAHFELITRLGTGGFGSVWEARDTELDRLVAVKIPRKSQLSARETEQFFREARTAAQLKHPHIVPVHEVGKDGPTIYIVTDLIHGVPMSDWLKVVHPSTQETARLCATLAEALSYAHEQGVIHRDLKPANVMLDENQQPHIMDFGLAKRELGEITMTVDGTVLGTPAYMSPEQAMGEMHWVDRRTDIYSLGVMLYQMLTGELPYRGTAQQQIQQRVVDDAPDPRKLNAHLPTDLATIALKCLERDANRRFHSAAEVAEELCRFLSGEPIKSRPISSIARAWRWAKRKPALATAGVLTCVLAVAGPLAAVAINSARVTINQQLDERNNVIFRKNQENDELDHQLQQAQQKLANIQAAYPGVEERSFWYKKLIADFVKKNQPGRQRLLEQTISTTIDNPGPAAQAHLGWEYLLHAAGKHQEAVEHGIAARNLLVTLNRAHPEVLLYRVFLAECLTELSELQHTLGQREAALESAVQALAIRSAIAEGQPDDLKLQFDELRSLGRQMEFDVLTTEEGKRTAVANDWLAKKTMLTEQLGVDSQDIYQLACYLTQHENHLRSDLSPVAAGELLEQDEVK